MSNRPRIRLNPFMILVIGFILIGFISIFSLIFVSSLGYFHILPTKSIHGVVTKIIPNIECSGSRNSSCSTEYYVSFKGDDNHTYQTVYYSPWSLPDINQGVNIRYMTLNMWPFKNRVVDIN